MHKTRPCQWWCILRVEEHRSMEQRFMGTMNRQGNHITFTVMLRLLQCLNNKPPVMTDYCNQCFYFMQNKGTTYWVELLHYLIFHPMNQEKDLSPRLDMFRLGGRKPQFNSEPWTLLDNSFYHMHSYVRRNVCSCNYPSPRTNTCSTLMREPGFSYMNSVLFFTI
jgi:hypothetical protein